MISVLLARLPSLNRLILGHLLHFLKRVSQESDVNKMTTDNLAIVFGPSLLRRKDSTPLSSAHENTYVNDVTKDLIECATELIPEAPIVPATRFHEMPIIPIGSSTPNLTLSQSQRETAQVAATMFQHKFQSVFFKVPTFCRFCNSFIWGVTSKQGAECFSCGFTIHFKCLKAFNEKPPACPMTRLNMPSTDSRHSVRPVSAQRPLSNRGPGGPPKSHNWQKGFAEKNQTCSHCTAVIKSRKTALACKECNLRVHDRCKLLLSPVLQQCQTSPAFAKLGNLSSRATPAGPASPTSPSSPSSSKSQATSHIVFNLDHKPKPAKPQKPPLLVHQSTSILAIQEEVERPAGGLRHNPESHRRSKRNAMNLQGHGPRIVNEKIKVVRSRANTNNSLGNVPSMSAPSLPLMSVGFSKTNSFSMDHIDDDDYDDDPTKEEPTPPSSHEHRHKTEANEEEWEWVEEEYEEQEDDNQNSAEPSTTASPPSPVSPVLAPEETVRMIGKNVICLPTRPSKRNDNKRYSTIRLKTSPRFKYQIYLDADQSPVSLGSLAGHGTFTEVFEGQSQGLQVAVKKFLLDSTRALEVAPKLENLVSVHKKLSHENVLKVIGSSLNEHGLFLVTDFATQGSLEDALFKRNELLTFAQRINIAQDIAKGLEYLHSCDLVHYNLKLSNILRDRNDQVKIADCGLAPVLAQGDDSLASPLYMAPELVLKKEGDSKCDVYSYGLVLFELTTNQKAFAENKFTNFSQVVEKVAKGGLRPKIPSKFPGSLKELLGLSWSGEPSSRPSFLEISTQDYFVRIVSESEGQF
eukprot:TRINITY_DN2229_c0_g1_i1.p1 TRINITY_DN2229_c0_g1~~TRINITY_DN2229_c0_g1_i1.p1  ORF type:complete len:804 (+),score=171.11 TRINITY_DN2229_c0_g1_i1:671-3082(+)